MIDVSKITITQFQNQFPQGIGGYSYLPVWVETQNYNIGDIVFANNEFYKCILANTNEVPPNATYWETYNDNIYSYISDMDITTAFLLASGSVGFFPSTRFINDTDDLIIYAYCLLVAHIILYFIKPQQFTYTGQTPSSIGTVNTQHVGNVSLGRVVPDAITNSVFASSLNSTLYGQQYLLLIEPRSKWRMLYSFGGIRN
jgi:hypothetical protein